jgi:hypothetical protein
MTQQRRRLPDSIPPSYCVAGEGMRTSHEWAPLREDDFYCGRCLARLGADDIERWRASRERARPPAESGPMVELTTGALAAEALTLTRLERRLLLRMAAEPDAVIGYSELAECVWGRPGADAHDRAALRQHIAMLRRKLALLRAEISTVASVGYRFKFGCADDSADHT